MRVNKPSIQGTATFRQIFSVREDRRSGGSVNMAAHFAKWKEFGLKLGAHNSQIVATEGQGSDGQSDITVGVAPKTT